MDILFTFFFGKNGIEKRDNCCQVATVTPSSSLHAVAVGGRQRGDMRIFNWEQAFGSVTKFRWGKIKVLEFFKAVSYPPGNAAANFVKLSAQSVSI